MNRSRTEQLKAEVAQLAASGPFVLLTELKARSPELASQVAGQVRKSLTLGDEEKKQSTKGKSREKGAGKEAAVTDAEVEELFNIRSYHEWYSRAIALVRQLLPERYDEFRRLYNAAPKRKDIDFTNYTIEDYLLGLRITNRWTNENIVDADSAFLAKFGQQIKIVASASSRIESLIANVAAVLQADLFDSELTASRELLQKGHTRAAAALSGVALERHLKTVAIAHGFATRKKSPTISEFNQWLRDQQIIDVPEWRRIQAFADIRNLAMHPKERDPTPDEVEDLIRGVERVTKLVG